MDFTVTREPAQAGVEVGFGVRGFFPRFAAGHFQLSVQANGFGAYCNPKADFPMLCDYAEVELAIFEGKAWVLPGRDPRFKDREWTKLFDDYDGITTSVAGYVPLDTVAEIYEDLCEVSKDMVLKRRAERQENEAGTREQGV